MHAYTQPVGGGGKPFNLAAHLLGIISVHGQGKIRIGFTRVLARASRVVQQCRARGAWLLPFAFLQ